MREVVRVILYWFWPFSLFLSNFFVWRGFQVLLKETKQMKDNQIAPPAAAVVSVPRSTPPFVPLSQPRYPSRPTSPPAISAAIVVVAPSSSSSSSSSCSFFPSSLSSFLRPADSSSAPSSSPLSPLAAFVTSSRPFLPDSSRRQAAQDYELIISKALRMRNFTLFISICASSFGFSCRLWPLWRQTDDHGSQF